MSYNHDKVLPGSICDKDLCKIKEAVCIQVEKIYDSCKDKDCIIFAGPPIADIKDKIYKNQDKCYKLVPTATKCTKNKKIVDFADSSAPV